MDSLELNGLLLSGGPLRIETKISCLRIEACTLDPRLGTSLLAADLDLNDRANYVLCRCVVGGLRIGDGIARLTIVNSIIDQSGSLAIMGLVGVGSPPGPIPTSPPPSSPPQIVPSRRRAFNWNAPPCWAGFNARC